MSNTVNSLNSVNSSPKRQLRVLELGNYIAPAYAGMILAEQGHEVIKWSNFKDPILSLNRGRELWRWINYRKELYTTHPDQLLSVDPRDGWTWPNIIIDNFRPSTLAEWGLDPQRIAEQHRLVWVSLRSEVGEVSFDLLAQTRSWLDFAPWQPFYIGDTAAGLWLAFKALSATAQQEFGHYTIGHATCLQKMVEGELVIDIERNGTEIPWDKEAYRFDTAINQAVIDYKNEQFREPPRNREWKLANLWHHNGRMKI